MLVRAAEHFIHGHPPCVASPWPQAVLGLRGLPGLTKVSTASTLCSTGTERGARPSASTVRQGAAGVRVQSLGSRALRSCAPTPLSAERRSHGASAPCVRWACRAHFRLCRGRRLLCSSWRPATFTLAPARSRRLFFRAPLPPGPPSCSCGPVGSVPEPRRRRRLILLSDPELGSGRESSFPPFPKTARPHERGTVKAWLAHFRSD